jgi:hypothetical protein
MPRHSDFSPEEHAFLDAIQLGSFADRTACPLPAELRAFASGVLPDSTRASVEEHIRSCGICQTMLEDLPHTGFPDPTKDEERRIRDRVFAEAEPMLVRPKVNWSWRLTPGFALVIVIAIGTSWLFFARQARQSPTHIRATANAPIPDVFQLDRPAAVVPPAVIWRGAGPDQELEAGLKGALDLYRIGNDAAAQSRFEALAARYPRSAEAHFYLGICLLFLGRNADAVTSLRTAREFAGDSLSDEVSWYFSVALVREGGRSEAQAIVQKLCQSPGAYQKRGCAGFEDLSRR